MGVDYRGEHVVNTSDVFLIKEFLEAQFRGINNYRFSFLVGIDYFVTIRVAKRLGCMVKWIQRAEDT